MSALLVVPPLIGAFAYVATNLGEHRAAKPGWRPAVYVLMWCVAAWLMWPLYSPYIAWIIPK